ncbi:MAG: SDR family NAD(P)-dependent oxidoreductase [Flavobacteriales bacterium]
MNILITGGASGLGAAITKTLAKDSANKVYFTYANSIDKAESITTEFKNTEALRCNFNDISSVNTLCENIPNLNIDILINNALTGHELKHFHKINTEVFKQSFQTNIMSTISISQAALKHFKKKKDGRIITLLTSYLINKPPVGLSEYVANKSYLQSLVKSWAVEFGKFGISSNAISPSFMFTGLTEDTDERVIDQMIQSHPLKKLLTTEEVAHTVQFLCNATKHINGHNLVINGGENL